MFVLQPTHMALERPVAYNNLSVHTSTDAFCPIYQDCWHNRHIPLWLHRVAIIFQVVENGVIVGMEDGSGDVTKFRVDITSRCSIFASLEINVSVQHTDNPYLKAQHTLKREPY